MKTLKNIKKLNLNQMNQIRGGGEVIFPYRDKIFILPPPPNPRPEWDVEAKRTTVDNGAMMD